MDPRRYSGSYARPVSQYYNDDSNLVNYAPLTGKRQSFAARAGQPPPHMIDPQPDHRKDREHGEHLATSNKLHERLAPLHTQETEYQSHRSPLSPASPLSPHSGSDRRGSVPHRSPLQQLEGKLSDISKEERRARLQELEYHANEKESANQSKRVNSYRTTQASKPRQLPINTASARNPSDSGPERRYASDPIGNRGRTVNQGSAYDSINRENVHLGKHGVGKYSHHSRNSSDPSQTQHLPRRSYDGDTAVRRSMNEDPRMSRERRAHVDMECRGSKAYRHRSRDAGFAGAAAAMAVANPSSKLDRTEGHENSRRFSDQKQRRSWSLTRGGNKKEQQQRLSVPYDNVKGDQHEGNIPASQQKLYADRTGKKQGLKAAINHQEPDPLPPSAVETHSPHGPPYQIPPQTAGGQHARARVGFDTATATPVQVPGPSKKHHGLRGLLHGNHENPREYQRTNAFDEWRRAGTAKLTLNDLMPMDTHEQDSSNSSTWWERRQTSQRSSLGTAPGAYDGPYEEEASSFKPPLYLKCGPLLRYTGIRREQPTTSSHSNTGGREIWRGSVMIVTLDGHSSYESVPVLRLFAQPMDPLPAQPPLPQEGSEDRPSEHFDPIAGQVKVSRTGRPLFVKHVDHLDGGVDFSRVEDETGLFETTFSQGLELQQDPNGQTYKQPAKRRSRIRRRDGEKAGKYREVKAARLHSERGATFWRFNIEVELGSAQARVAYRINRGPAVGFWVPARGETMNIMFHSCNGFSLSVDPNQFSGPDPLWRDVLNQHQIRPFHVMIGGGDQIYNDAAMRDTELFKDWLNTKDHISKHKADFSEEMQAELEEFYLNRYSMWFSQGLFGLANSQIPMINIWDDHDIIDGYGSYPHHFMSTNVFTGLGAIAFKYYMLFQHQSVVAETQREEPSWLLGASPGPYINELSRSIFLSLGHKVAFLGLDCRTERMRDEILSQGSYDIIFDRCRAEIISGDTKHLIVLLGVPIAYPRLNFLENILTSRIMDPIKAIGRTGILGGFVNKFDGGVEILDDLDDHWTAKHHKAERNWFIQELQELAAEKSVRVTILGGDVHLGAIGQFYTNKKLGVPKDCDHRYMPNVISSAIVNTPPPNVMGDILNKRNKIHHLDSETDEDMIPMFEEDVDGKPRNNLHLLPRRNYCIIREYVPGSTPPPTPPPEAQTPTSAWSQSQDYPPGERYFPPGSMKRTLSLTGGSFRPGNLVRRLSGSRTRAPPTDMDAHQYRHTERNGAFPQQNRHTSDMRRSSAGGNSANNTDSSYFPPGSTAHGSNRPGFYRRPTDLSEKKALKAVARGGAEANIDGREAGHINLEGGLDIILNVEVNQQNPAGITTPYRLLVPALFYEGPDDLNTARFRSKRATLMDRLRGRDKARSGDDDERSYSGSDNGSSRTPSVESGFPERYTTAGQIPTYPPPQPRSGGLGHHNGARKSHLLEDKEFGPAPPLSSHPYNKHVPLTGQALPRTQAQRYPASDAVKERRASGGLFGFRRVADDGQEDYGRERYGEDADDSLFPSDSEVSSLDYEPPLRKPSKADKILGVPGGRSEVMNRHVRQQQQQQQQYQQRQPPQGFVEEEDLEEKPERRKGWKIWK